MILAIRFDDDHDHVIVIVIVQAGQFAEGGPEVLAEN